MSDSRSRHRRIPCGGVAVSKKQGDRVGRMDWARDREQPSIVAPVRQSRTQQGERMTLSAADPRRASGILRPRERPCTYDSRVGTLTRWPLTRSIRHRRPGDLSTRRAPLDPTAERGSVARGTARVRAWHRDGAQGRGCSLLLRSPRDSPVPSTAARIPIPRASMDFPICAADISDTIGFRSRSIACKKPRCQGSSASLRPAPGPRSGGSVERSTCRVRGGGAFLLWLTTDAYGEGVVRRIDYVLS